VRGAVLEEVRQRGRWLLVFDNAGNPWTATATTASAEPSAPATPTPWPPPIIWP
jgi:hypothetical protein